MDSRLENLRKLFIKQSFDAVLISSVPNIIYLTGYQGFSSEERDAYLFVTKKNAYLITNALYITAAKQIKHVKAIESSRNNLLKDILGKIIKSEKVKDCGYEEDNITVAEYKTFPSDDIVFNAITLDTLREEKSEDELEKIQQACAIGDKAFTYIQTQLIEGISEIELANKLELFIKNVGYDISFRTIAAFGTNAAVPHHLSGNTTLERNMVVLLDYGVRFENYCSDMTRTIFFGKPDKRHEHIYKTVKEAQQLAIDELEKKLQTDMPTAIAVKDIDAIAREYILAQSYPSIPHTLGHGIGLEVHEGIRIAPNSKNTFKNGMVFSIEPGIYLPDEVGVRIEDLFTIKNNKLIKLTHSKNSLISIYNPLA